MCFSVWQLGHVALELDDELRPVPAGAAHPVHPGLVPAVRLLRAHPVPAARQPPAGHPHRAPRPLP